jgi:hypothetical protein
MQVEPKIVPIFAKKLFAFQDDGEFNELRRLLLLWNDPTYLYEFVTLHKSDAPKDKSTREVVRQIIEDANEIDTLLKRLITTKHRSLGEFFKPLHNQEYRILELSKQKGRNNYLRIYALRIDVDCYVITGGAIKFTHLMKERPHTAKELLKIEQRRNYLIDCGVSDADSFYELLIELQ